MILFHKDNKNEKKKECLKQKIFIFKVISIKKIIIFTSEKRK